MKRLGLVKFILFLLILGLGANSMLAAAPSVFYCQLGYRPEEPKFFALPDAAKSFSLMEAKTNKAVFSGEVVGPVPDAATGLSYWRGDFSTVKRPGEYYILVDGQRRSENFKIGEDVWRDAQRLVLRSYYLQRCGIAIKDPASKIEHDVCHQDDGIIRYADAYHKEEDAVDAKGGWHDAGDYGKYISSAGITVSLMLLAYELYPDRVASDATGIPESGNGKPDLLDEARWELEWMLKMQRPDGAVYHKLSGLSWPNGLPEDDWNTRYLFGVSTSATAKFAATVAFASRIYRKFDPVFADKLLKAAEFSWNFLMTAPNQPDPGPQDNSGSGPYGDPDTRDDLFWTAVELYLSSGDKSYQDYALHNIPPSAVDPGWVDGSALALYHYAAGMKDEGAVQMRQLLTEAAGKLVAKASKSAFGIATAKDEFMWASNKKIMSDSILLILADRLSPNPANLKVAYMQLHYIFGFNPLAKSYVTGLGINPVTRPHHRIFWATGQVVPGEMSGGPNNKSQSGIEPPDKGALSYTDESPSYSSNEYAIDYNASLLFVLVSANG